MDLRRFVLALVAVIVAALAFFFFLVLFGLPLAWLAKIGFPGSVSVGDIAEVIQGRRGPNLLGLVFIGLEVASSLVLLGLLIPTMAKLIDTFEFLTSYYKKLFQGFVTLLLALCWLLPTLWVFVPFDLVPVVAIAGGLATLGFTAITIVLRDVLIWVHPPKTSVKNTSLGDDHS